jgi:hypothetical protein
MSMFMSVSMSSAHVPVHVNVHVNVLKGVHCNTQAKFTHEHEHELEHEHEPESIHGHITNRDMTTDTGHFQSCFIFQKTAFSAYNTKDSRLQTTFISDFHPPSGTNQHLLLLKETYTALKMYVSIYMWVS